jgi:hypothetical protein
MTHLPARLRGPEPTVARPRSALDGSRRRRFSARLLAALLRLDAFVLACLRVALDAWVQGAVAYSAFYSVGALDGLDGIPVLRSEPINLLEDEIDLSRSPRYRRNTISRISQ